MAWYAGLAQELAGFNITQHQGLPSNTVYNLFVDDAGFLWVATDNGLARYNGIHFKEYENPFVRSKACSGILQDSEGCIWFHNFFGEILFIENDSLQKLESWDTLLMVGFPNLAVRATSLFVSDPKHLYEFDKKQNEWKNLDAKLNETHPLNIHHQIVSRKNHVWICFNVGSDTFVKNITENRIYAVPYGEFTLESNYGRLIEWQGEIWLQNSITEKLFRVDEDNVFPITNRFKEQLKGNLVVKNIGDSILAFAGNNGIQLWMPDNKWVTLLPGKRVSSVAADKEGGIWIGTLNDGIYYYPNLTTFLLSERQRVLFTKLVADKRNHQIIAGGHDGLINVFSANGKMVNEIRLPNEREVQSIFIDTTANRLLVGTNFFYSYDLTTLRQQSKRNLAAVKKIERIADDYVLATSWGLVVIDATTVTTKKQLFPQRMSTLAYQQASGKLWIGSQKGLYTFLLKSDTLTLWQPDSALYSPGVSAMVAQHNHMFIGTFTNGLLVVQNQKVIHHFRQHNGLPSNRITALCLEGDQLWIGTDKGVANLNLKTNKLFHINETKGLASNEVYDIAVLQNTLWVTHSGGIQFFSTIPVKNTQPPRLHLVTVKSDDRNLTDYAHGLILDPTSQQLTILLDVSNNLKSRGTTRIYYRIKEIEKDRWNVTTLSNPVANYLSLPSGQLTFEAYAVNEDGIASANIISLPLTVLTPFWKKSWFTAALFFFVFMLISLLVIRRAKTIEKRNKLKLIQQNQAQELRIAQLTSIRAQMNPHFIFNTMALIQGKVLNGLKEEANQQIQNFSILMRNVLDYSGKEMILLQDEVAIIEKYLSIENVRLDGLLKYTIEVEGELKNEPVRIPSLITQPFVENALRHGLMHKQGEKKLYIQFALAGNYIKIQIEDNGIGRKASAEFNKARRPGHQSFALEAYHKRIDLLNATHADKISLEIIDLYNAQNIPVGTRVIISIPTTL
jgi:ligand-binding sensor domain-containing protein